MLLVIMSFTVLIFGAEGWLWYAGAAINGLAMCTGSVAVPHILSKWFPNNSGFATGFAMAFSGIGGAICNPLCARLILRLGWRSTIFILGAIMLLLTIPALFLMFRWTPEVMLVQAAKDTVETDGSKQMGTFLLLCIALLGGNLGVQFVMNLSMYAQSIGYTLTIGASLTTMVMIGNVVSKFLYGCLCDVLGTWRSTALMLCSVVAAVLCLIFAQSTLVVLMGASLVYGCVYALYMISVTRCCAAAYGDEECQKYLGLHVCINNGTAAVFTLLMGSVFDKTQSFVPALVMILAMLIASLFAVWRLSVRTGLSVVPPAKR